MGQFILRIFNSGDVQVASHGASGATRKNHLGGLAGGHGQRGLKRGADPIGVRRADKGQQKIQWRILLERAQQAQRHGVALQHQAVLIDQHQRQWHIGEERQKTLCGALGGSLAVAQRLVLDLEFGLVLSQLPHAPCGWRCRLDRRLGSASPGTAHS